MNAGDIYHVDVMDNLSYFNTSTDKKDIVLKAFESYSIDGRSIKVRVTQKRGQHLQNNKFSGDYGKGRSRKGDGFGHFSKKRKKKGRKGRR
jgi:hypothetical protein